MIREECEAAREEREGTAEARVERETAAAKQWRLMAEVYELKLQLAEEIISRTAAVQYGTGLSLTAGDISSPCGGWEASLLQALHVRKPQRAAETATAELCRSKGGIVRAKSNRLKTFSCSMGTKAKFPAWTQNFLCLAKLHGLFGIFTEGVDVPVADEMMSIAALQEAFPHENIQKHFIAWNILSRAIARNGDRDTLRHASSPAADGVR